MTAYLKSQWRLLVGTCLPDTQRSAKSGRLSSDPHSNHLGGMACHTPTCRMIDYADSRCFPCLVILPCTWFLLLNSNIVEYVLQYSDFMRQNSRAITKLGSSRYDAI